MDLHSARFSGGRRTLIVVTLLGSIVQCRAREAEAQTSKKRAEAKAAACGARDVRSTHFLVHTDLLAHEANELVERLETMLRLVSTYWGRPMQGMIECYVVRDLDTFPQDTMAPAGISGIRNQGGVTLTRAVTDGKRFLAKAVVYADARPEVVQHESVHAYCHHTFGRIGPVWYSEGMAEMGHYWKEDDSAVRAGSREIRFLREHLPKSLKDTLSPLQASGDSWQNYASRWALCHFLIHHPNYSPQFSALGRGLLGGKDVSFEQTFGAMAWELSFEYLFFLEHIGPGYRVDLCAWDWSKRAAGLRTGRTLTATVAAGRGWQPTGLSLSPGMRYGYAATGNWRIGRESAAVDANGDGRGRGRLVGALMKDFRLSPEFDLGTEGSLQLNAGGDLYLRCRSAWNELADDSGRLAVKLKVQGRCPSARKAETKDRIAGEASLRVDCQVGGG